MLDQAIDERGMPQVGEMFEREINSLADYALVAGYRRPHLARVQFQNGILVEFGLQALLR